MFQAKIIKEATVRRYYIEKGKKTKAAWAGEICGKAIKNSSHKYTTISSSGVMGKQKRMQGEKKPKDALRFYTDLS